MAEGWKQNMYNGTAPTTDLDLFSEATIRDPYPVYQRLRDLGPAVWSDRHQVYVLSRYDDVKAALRNWQIFSSASGIGMNDMINQNQAGTTLASDPPLHDALRRIIAPPLSPKDVKNLMQMIETEATSLVERLIARGTFDLVKDLCAYLPYTIVTRLVGLPEAGREGMTIWGIAGFDVAGPLEQPRTGAAVPTMMALLDYVADPTLRERVLPGSWAANIFAAADRGDIRADQTIGLLLDYIAPSLDTTISAMSNTLWLLAQHPEAWDAIRANADLIPPTILESIRLETPVRGFTRVTTAPVNVDGVTIPEGARVLLLYASANRDERKWPEPERFDIYRRPIDHLGFGHGVHACVGLHLAQIEIRAVMTALASRVARLDMAKPELLVNNFLRGFERVPVQVR
jgi:cytochrome P450